MTFLQSPYFWGPLIIGVLIAAAIGYVARQPGRDLAFRYAMFGSPVGKPLSSVVAAIGPPTGTTAAADGASLVSWNATGFALVLVVDDRSVCTAVQHQFNADGITGPPRLATPEEQRMPVLVKLGIVVFVVLAGAAVALMVAYSLHLVR